MENIGVQRVVNRNYGLIQFKNFSIVVIHTKKQVIIHNTLNNGTKLKTFTEFHKCLVEVFAIDDITLEKLVKLQH